MRSHPDPRAEAATSRAMADAEFSRALSRFRLEIDGEPVIPRAIRYRADDVRAGDSYAMLLELTLPGSWPDTAEGKTAIVDLLISDPESDFVAVWREFEGRIKFLEPTDDGDTEIEAYTPGEILSRQKTGRVVAWSGHTPKKAMHEAVKDAGYKRIDLRSVPNRPFLTREADEVFEESASRTELLEDIRNQAQAVFFDDPDGTGRGLPLAALNIPTAASAPQFAYVVGRDIRRGAFKVRPAQDGRYSEVVVSRELPQGGREVLRRIRVNNRGVFVPNGVEYEVEATDVTLEALTEALTTGSEAARMLEYGAWEFEVQTLILDPRIVRGTHGTIEETREEGRFSVTRVWRVVVAGYSRDPKDNVHTMSGAAYKILEVKVPLDAPRLFDFSKGVERMQWGITLDGDYGYAEDALEPIFTADEDYVYLDEAAAAAANITVTDTGEEITLDD